MKTDSIKSENTQNIRGKFKFPKRIFLGLSSFQIMVMFRRGLFYTYLSLYLKEFLGLSVTQTSLFATVPMILNVIFQNFVWGPLSDKTQRRRTLVIVGEILAGIGTICVWFIHKIPTSDITAGFIVIIGLACIEIFWSMSNIGWSALISDIYPSKERERVMGQLQSIGGLGRIIGIFIGGSLYGTITFHYEGWGFAEGWLFFISAGIMFISAIPMFFTPEGGEISSDTIDNDENKINQPIIDNQKFSWSIFLFFIISLIFINFGRNSIATIFPQYLSLDKGFNVNSEILSYIVNTSSIATIIFGMITGWLSKKIGHGGTLVFGTALALIGMVGIALSGYLFLIYIANFLIGASYVMLSSASYTIASILIPIKHRGKLFAVYNATFFLSWGFAGTIISGPIIDKLGSEEVFSYQLGILIGSMVTTIGLIILVFLLFRMKNKKVL